MLIMPPKNVFELDARERYDEPLNDSSVGGMSNLFQIKLFIDLLDNEL